MLIEVLLFILGIFLVVKGSDYFVESASSIARKLGVSEFVIGLTLVAIGTSLPELASAITSALKGVQGLALGNVIGANIANLGLIAGISAIFAGIKVKKSLIRREIFVLLIISSVFFISLLDYQISKFESIGFLILYGSYLIFLFHSREKKPEKKNIKGFLKYFSKKKNVINQNGNHKSEFPFKQLAILIFSGIAVGIGADYLVNGAVFFARTLSVPETIIGLTIISLGTTLPELSVSVSAARKGLGGIAIGNVLGSCIANILLIIGVSTLILSSAITPLIIFSASLLLLMVFIFTILIITKGISRGEGIGLVVAYLICLILLSLVH